MKLYYLSIVERAGYDCYDSFVVRAKSADDARSEASRCAGDEGGGTWLDNKLSTCEPISTTGTTEIICASFNAG